MSSARVYNSSFTSDALFLTKTDGTGFIELKSQSTAPAAPTGSTVRLYNQLGKLKIIDSGEDVISSIAQYLIFPISLGISSGVYMNTLNGGTIIFPGTNLVAVNEVAFVAYNSVADTEGSLRIFDFTNSNMICEITGINSTIDTLYSTTNISNLSATRSIWQVQAKKDTGTGEFRPTSAMIVLT